VSAYDEHTPSKGAFTSRVTVLLGSFGSMAARAECVAAAARFVWERAATSERNESGHGIIEREMTIVSL
jgi:hypothetical protein